MMIKKKLGIIDLGNAQPSLTTLSNVALIPLLFLSPLPLSPSFFLTLHCIFVCFLSVSLTRKLRMVGDFVLPAAGSQYL